MMIEEDFCLHKLVLRDIRPTAIRVLVLRTLLEMKQAMCFCHNTIFFCKIYL